MIFFTDADRRLFLSWLGAAAEAEGCALHAYVLMSNHVHLLLTSDSADGLPRLMQSLGRRYVRYINITRGRTGTLWEGRYRATILDSETYVLACHRYIEANPLRARIVDRPQDHRWSSHNHNAYGQVDPLLSEHPSYQALGTTPAIRQEGYRALFAQGLDGALLDTLRDATHRGWVPGSESFLQSVQAAIGRNVAIPRRGRPPRLTE
jgi:putative transposase